MNRSQSQDHFYAELRSKLASSQIDSGLSLGQISDLLNLEPPNLLGDYFKGTSDLPLWVLFRYSQIVNRPIWWFFGEQPKSISIESAQNALTNLSRARLYLNAIESEFQAVISTDAIVGLKEPSSIESSDFQNKQVVVDFAPYLARARAMLEQEAECSEESEEVFEESVEMIAHQLYSLEMAANPSRESMPSVQR